MSEFHDGPSYTRYLSGADIRDHYALRGQLLGGKKGAKYMHSTVEGYRIRDPPPLTFIFYLILSGSALDLMVNNIILLPGIF